MQRLEKSREETIDRAREALLANPATSHLVDDRPVDVADPTRDASPCFRQPTARCLLAEAAESAKAIPRDNMRDWALGELLAAQARAGLPTAAMTTVGRIGDPRLIMVALREIAEAQASVGRYEEALAATRIIPNHLKRVEALIAIADIQARRGDGDDARAVVGQLIESLDQVSQKVKRIAFRAQAATVLVSAGHRRDGETQLGEAESQARAQKRLRDRRLAFRYVASALAEMGDMTRAIELLDEAGERSDRTPLLIAAAKAMARDGNVEAAQKTATGIVAARYRSIVLCSIAAAEAEAGNVASAVGLVDDAQAAIETIKFPYARAFALSRVALALSDIGRVNGVASFDRAVTAATDISDTQLKAQILWTLVADRRRAGDTAGAVATQDLAETASVAIKSALSRVWMYGDLARDHLDAGERTEAFDAFKRSLHIAEAIENAWARARALSRVADTLIEITGADGTASP